MTIDDVLAELRSRDPESYATHGLVEPCSYRGFYDQIAFSLGERMKIKDIIQSVDSVIGATFTGWKGGSYVMVGATIVNIAAPGASTGDDDALTPELLNWILRGSYKYKKCPSCGQMVKP